MIPQSGENPPNTIPKLSARRLSKAFGPVTVLQDVDVHFFAGEIHAVVGENGAGKSTLMRILSGILEPTAGEVWFDGRPVGTGDLRAMEKLGVRLIVAVGSTKRQLGRVSRNTHFAFSFREFSFNGHSKASSS